MVKRDKKLSLFLYPDIYNKLYSMIKQTWEISNEERKRILSLHESATKNLYLMSEQDVVQGPGGPSTFYDQDENYRYYISQPTYSVGSDYVDYKKLYFVYAMGTEGSFQCKITSKNEKGQPTSFEVLTDKPLPVLSNNPDINQFQFEMIKTSKKTYQWGQGNEITTNAYLGKETEGPVQTGGLYFAVYDARKGKPETVVVKEEKSGTYKDYNINFDELEVGSTTLFNPSDEGFYSRFIGRFSLYMPSLKSSYPIDPEDFNPKKPEDIPGKTPTPPQPVSLGDKFANNISLPNRDAILNDPNFIEFKKFVESNDMTKFVFVIESSASKCAAGYKEANNANGKWSDDKDNYPDVVVADGADKNDLGNLNLTKARAQNLKNFLIMNLPKLKNSKFEVIAQGSIGICGTEAENQKYRKVNLDVRKL
jgi:hypothetical protein